MTVPARAFPLEPWVTAADLGRPGRRTWEDVDHVASRVLGRACLGIPSVRVGMTWALEFLGLSRHRDHVLVPRYVGRCILNALNRHALPVEAPTAETRVVVAVDQFGLRHDHAAVAATCARRGWSLLEDSPCGIADDEVPGEGSLARFVGLAKALPVVQGALVLSADARFLDFVRRKRSERSLWSWAAWGAMTVLRRRRYAVGYSALADLAYEMYVPARGGNAWLRANVARVLESADTLASVHRARLGAIARHVGTRALMPEIARLAYVVPFVAGEMLEPARAVLRRTGFDDAVYHVDVARNVFAPRYETALLLPVNARVSDGAFSSLVEGLAALDEPARSAPLLASASTQRHFLVPDPDTTRGRSA